MRFSLPFSTMKCLFWGMGCWALSLGHAQSGPATRPVFIEPNETWNVVVNANGQPLAANNSLYPGFMATNFEALHTGFAQKKWPYALVPSPSLVLPLRAVQVLDERPQKKYTGFLPVDLDQKKKGIGVIGMDLGKGSMGLVREWMEQRIDQAEQAPDRTAVFVWREFWFSQNASTHRHSPNGGLETTLHYALDVYSFYQDQFYPQFQCVGENTQPFAEGRGYDQLLDAFFSTLQQKLADQNWEKPETPAKAIAPKTFQAHYQEKRAAWQKAFQRPPGLYASYADYLAQKPIADSVQVLQRFTLNQQMPLYALTLQAKAGEEEKNVYGTWGYCDGESLFYHLGNGLFIKLIQWENSFVFPHLNLFLRDNVKAKTLLGLRLGQSEYALIKEYSRITPLTYQLNLVTGTLY